MRKLLTLLFSTFLLAAGETAGEGQPPVDPRVCDASVYPDIIGTVGTSGPCKDLLIVDNDMIRSAASNFAKNKDDRQGDKTFDFKPGDSYTSHEGDTYDFTQIYTGNVTDLSYLFSFTDFNQDISDWDVSNVTNMHAMIGYNDDFNQDISNWDTSSVTHITHFMDSNSAFTYDLSDWTVCQMTNPANYAFFADNSDIEAEKLPKFGEACPAPVALLAEASVAASSIDQSLSAGALASILNQHAAPAAGQDTSASALDWYTLGFSQSDSSEILSGSGTFVYGMVGNQISQSDAHTFGYALGLEQGTWDYSADAYGLGLLELGQGRWDDIEESNVTKTGLSAAVYGGRTLESVTLQGSAMLTTFQNQHTNKNTGAKATSSSNRLMLSGLISGNYETSSGASLSPYAEATYATETIGSYSYDDSTTTYEGTSADVGTISLGVQYTMAPIEGVGILHVRGQFGSTFGTDTIALSDGGEIYTPHDAPTGELTLGWTSTIADDTQASVDLTIGQIGNKNREEIKLDGTFNRQF